MSAAKAEATDVLPALPPAPPSAGKGGMIAMMLVAILVSTGASGGIAFWLSTRNAAPAAGAEAEAEPEKKAPALYHPLSPAFVVNLEDDEAMRFLQVDIEAMTRDAAVVEAIKLHTPQIRNSLLLLLGQQRAHELHTREHKEKLQAAVLAEVQRILAAETGKPGVEAVYFTSFVMQ